MGRKKKSIKKVVVKEKPKLPRSFKCPLCYTDESVACDLDFAEMKGRAHCAACGESFECNVHSLSAPVDVFHDWIDRLEEERATGANALPSQSYGDAPQEPAYGEDVFEDVREFRTKSRKRARPAGDAAASRNELEREAGEGDASQPATAPAPAPAPGADAHTALDDQDALFGDEMEDDGELMFDD